jgi:hypothetical protein
MQVPCNVYPETLNMQDGRLLLFFLHVVALFSEKAKTGGSGFRRKCPAGSSLNGCPRVAIPKAAR